MDINVFCLCALAVFGVTLGQNPEENKDLTPRELLKNTHTQHEHFAKTMMLPLLEKLTKTPTLMSKIQSKGLAMKASHGTESEFHLNYEKIRSNIASMKVRHSAKSEFELKPNYPSASVAMSSAAQTAETTPKTTPKPKQDASSSPDNDDSTKRKDTDFSEKANETSKTESPSSETNKMQSNKNADKSPKPKSKNSSSKKVDETTTPKKKSSSKRDTSRSVEKDDSLSQVNNSPRKHTLHIVITHVFHSSLPQGAGKFDVAIPVHLPSDYDTNPPEVRTRKTFKSNANFKEASRGIIKVSIIMACIINKNELNTI